MRFLLLLVTLSIFCTMDVAAQDDYPLLKGYPAKTMSLGDTSRRVKFTEGEEALRAKVRAAVKAATANVEKMKWYDQFLEIGSRAFLNDRDTTIPLTFTCKYFPGKEALDEAIKRDSTLIDDKERLAQQVLSAEVELFINPVSDAKFKITGPFTNVDVPGATFAISVDQKSQFTAVFLGTFSDIIADRKEDRPAGSTRYPSLIAAPKYDTTRSYLDVQSIYVIITAEAESAKKIIEQFDFAALNALIEKQH